MTTLDELIKANLPAPFMLQEFLDETGEELPSNYQGTSTSINLADIFQELAPEDWERLSNTPEPIPTIILSHEEYEGMVTRRFELSEIEHNVLASNRDMLWDENEHLEGFTAETIYENYLYLALVRLIYRNTCTIEGAQHPVFTGLWQVWEKTFYPEISIPPYLIRNVLEMFEIAYDEQAQRDFPEGALPMSGDSFDDAVYVAFQMPLNHIIEFWSAGVSCKGIRILLDGGVESREALELGQTMPLAWIEALEAEPRKWWYNR